MAATFPSSATMRTTSRVKAVKSMGEQAALQQILWAEDSEPDPVAETKNDFSSWLQDVARNEKLFEEHVYKNPDLSELDLHQHRARLFLLCAQGEHLIVEFLKLGYAKKIEPANFFQLIQEQLESLLTAFNAWHGPLEAQDDIPEDFKEGMRDIAEGKIVDLDTALNEKPPADGVHVSGV